MARLFIEQLCAVDFARLDGERGLLGDTWLLDVELEGALDEQGMILDFGKVKPAIKSLVDNTIDHRLLVPRRHKGLEVEDRGTEVRLRFRYGDRMICHRSPPDALCFLDEEVVTPELVGLYLQREARAVLPENVTGLVMGLREESISGPWYRYAHGLRQHEGNCQRIAHGHRSRIEIFREGRRCEATERWLADRWRDIYLGCRKDLAGEISREEIRYYRFFYTAAQGSFELEIEADRCELLDAESTVECLAEHILGLVKSRDPGVEFRVRAYEGVNKGAIATG
ncbi:MAG: 6-carboxytetrahydropterin synthase [Gammaproteobacteria bacterium]